MKVMENLEWLLEQMDEELDDAEKYAWKSLKCKDNHNEIARTTAELSRQELTHYEMIQSVAVKYMKTLMEEHPEQMESLETFWEFENGRMTRRKTNIDHLLKSFHK